MGCYRVLLGGVQVWGFCGAFSGFGGFGLVGLPGFRAEGRALQGLIRELPKIGDPNIVPNSRIGSPNPIFGNSR